MSNAPIGRARRSAVVSTAHQLGVLAPRALPLQSWSELALVERACGAPQAVEALSPGPVVVCVEAFVVTPA